MLPVLAVAIFSWCVGKTGSYENPWNVVWTAIAVAILYLTPSVVFTALGLFLSIYVAIDYLTKKK